MKYEYQKAMGPHGEAVFIPMVPILFPKPQGGSIGLYALVDSGATRSFFDAKYAPHLGIEDVERGLSERFYGVTGNYIVGFRHDVTLMFANTPIKMNVSFCPEFPKEVFGGILGREDFFAFYRIRFIEKNTVWSSRTKRASESM